MTRIGRLFETLKRENRKGLIAYLTAGDPSPLRTPALVAAMVRGGADLIELGVPFSDPIADGPVIQRGGERALKAGTTLATVLEIAARFAPLPTFPCCCSPTSTPSCAMAWNASPPTPRPPASMAACSPMPAWKRPKPTWKPCIATAWTPSFWPRPPARERRIKLVAQYSTGFVYLVSRTGVTGEQDSLSASVAPLVQAVRAATDLPLAVGFGISKPAHVAELGRLVEAVVVGSAFVRLIEQNAENPALETKLEDFTRELKSGFGAMA